MHAPLTFDQITLGDRWVSQGRTVTESDLVQFACLTGDFNPLHVDHEYARNTPFGKRMAHGLLGLAWVAGLGSHAPLVKTVAFVSVDEWQFLRPAFIGDTMHVETEAVEKDPRKGKRPGRVAWKRQLVNQEAEVVQEGIFRTLVAKE